MPHSSAGEPDRAAPVKGIRLEPMALNDVDQVLAIERRSFTTPWRREHFAFEIRENRWAWNRVLRHGSRIVAYACCWLLEEEMKINDFAVHEGWRGRGIGRWFLRELIAEARDRGCRSATLEVREKNEAALALYAGEGFVGVGRRKGYYQRDGEDAIVMELRWEDS